jgi:dethiobiotin synthetase
VRGLFVTGTDTGAGKTIVSAALLAAMVHAGERVVAHKPVVTGLDEPTDSWPADHELLAAAAGMRPEDVAPLRFGPAVSPHLAAQLAGAWIDPAEVVARARRAGEPHTSANAEPSSLDRPDALDEPPQNSGSDPSGHTLIVEGVGGLLVPLCDDFTVRDLAVALGLEVLIAARTGLGTINHTLLTLQAARAAGLAVRAVVLTPWPEQPSPMERSNRETIASLGQVEVAVLRSVPSPAIADLARAGDALPWQLWRAGWTR